MEERADGTWEKIQKMWLTRFRRNTPSTFDSIARAGTSLVIQWLRLCLPMQGAGSIPCWETKIPHAVRYGQIFFLIARPTFMNTKEASARAISRNVTALLGAKMWWVANPGRNNYILIMLSDPFFVFVFVFLMWWRHPCIIFLCVILTLCVLSH